MYAGFNIPSWGYTYNLRVIVTELIEAATDRHGRA